MSSTTEKIRQIKGVSGLSEESAHVRPGDVFVACARDLVQRAQHIEQAIDSGALGVVVDAQSPAPAGLPVVAAPNLASQRGALAADFYAYPSRRLGCVGVTGTNGKTSIAYHVANLSNLLGINSGYIGTLGNGILDQLSPGSMTTPSPVTLQRLLAGFEHQGLQRAALEISSHALDQGRAEHVELDVGVFSNLTRDHLDYHQSMQQYAEAKAKLFTNWPLRLAVINADDELGRRLITCCRADEVISYGAAGDIAWRATGVRRGMHVLFDTPWGRLETALPVAADFALANVAAAIGVLLGLGHGINELSQVLPRLTPIPGRMQVIEGAFGTPKVIVDFAHTPDALKKVLSALASQCRGRLVCIVGCGGDRDQGKRATMGAVAVNGSDQVWFTSDNPRSEDPKKIIQEMQGELSVQQLRKVKTLADRGAAIGQAIADAGADDIVLIAGKGHESSQEIHGVKHDFSDIEFVEKLFKENV